LLFGNQVVTTEDCTNPIGTFVGAIVLSVSYNLPLVSLEGTGHTNRFLATRKPTRWAANKRGEALH
jgi:hypothetical protein